LGTDLYKTTITTSTGFQSAGSVIYIYVPYYLTYTEVLGVFDVRSATVSQIINTPSPYTGPVYIPNQLSGAAYTNGVIFSFAYNYRASVTVIGR
jgi:hypothetical protein